MLATLFGLAWVVALVISVPLYADAIYYKSFHTTVTEVEGASRPPFSFLFKYVGGWYGTKQWQDVQDVDLYLSGEAQQVLGLPELFLVRHFKTEPFGLFPESESVDLEDRSPFVWASIAFISDLQDHISLIKGNYHENGFSSAEGYVDILLSDGLAGEYEMGVGDVFIAVIRDENLTGGVTTTQIPLRVTGIWKPQDPQGSFWFSNPQHLKDLLLVSEESFIHRVAPSIDDEVYTGVWYLVMDGSGVNASDAGNLLGRINIIQRRAAVLLPDIKLEASPAERLFEYRQAATVLTILLFAFSVPIIALMLAFIWMVARATIERQRNEIAVLRSRGTTVPQIIGIVAIEAILLGAIALGIGSLLGGQIARTIGQFRTFLEFSGQSDLRVSMTTTIVWVGVISVGVALIALVLPAIKAAQHTIVSYKQERARMLRPPWWQRAYVDVLLMIPAVYGAYLLRQQGSIAVFGVGVNRNPFENPLLFLVPALGIFSLTLIFIRILPLLMRAIAWIAGQTSSVSFLMAARHLARNPGNYIMPLVLLILTVSLSAFTATLARTLDYHLRERTYYQIGADLKFSELGEWIPPNPLEISSAQGDEQSRSQWDFTPVSDYLEAPGVRSAVRVGRYPAVPRLSAGSDQEGVFMGVDRYYLPGIAFWRGDFSPYSLGALMNELALKPDGVLVDRNFMMRSSLQQGDTIRLSIETIGQIQEIELQIAGSFDLFPTWYPDEGPLFVGNLDYLFDEAGGEFPYQVWLSTDPNMNQQTIVEQGLRGINPAVLDWDSSLIVIDEQQRQPERQGLFGVLSIGFAAAVLLTVIGILLYAYFSFRRRFIELGVLRAIGLSAGRMASYLAWELTFLILLGVGIGTGLGTWMSILFIPYLQVGTDVTARIPPYQVRIDLSSIFQIYVLFVLLFLITLGVLVVLLKRMKIFQAIKLGETI